MTGTSMSKADFALDIAAGGLPAFPLEPNSEDPLIPNWRKVATTDPEQIRECWKLCPDANIGISTKGLLVIDFDEDCGPESIAKLKSIFAEHSTPYWQTLGGAGVCTRERKGKGAFMIYALPPGATVETAIDLLAPHISVFGSNDFVVGPGSTIDDIRWTFAPANAKVEPAPSWLMDMCGVRLPKSKSVSNVISLRKAAAPETALKTKLDWAKEAVARLHIDVFPVRGYVDPGPDATPEERLAAAKAAKTPLIANWQNEATQDLAKLDAWWEEWPDANIGGVTQNHIVVDIDNRNSGDVTFAALTDIGYDFPDTATTRTQGGGQHLIYVAPDGPVKGGTNKLGKGIDIKARGGYILLPGSTIECRPYVCENARPPAFAPAWLVDQLKTAKPKTSAAGKRIVEEDEISIAMADNYLRHHAPRAQYGNIDDTTNKVAAMLYDFGCTQETVYEKMLGWNETHCEPPGDIDRLAVVVESSGRNRDNAIGCKHPLAPGFEARAIDESKAPRFDVMTGVTSATAPADWNEPTDLWVENSRPASLPSQALPDLVESAARDRGRRLGVEPGAPAAALLTVLGSLVPAGNRLQMRQHDTEWTVKPIQWTAIIGPPGSNKSATIGYAVSAVQKLETGWRKSFASAERNWKVAEARRAAAAKAKPENPDQIFAGEPGPEKPRFRQKLFNDATTEALAVALSENPEGLLYHADELAGWLGSMDAYRAKGGKDRPFWLQAKEGGPLTINRKTSERICVENCAISVLGGIQPDKIRALKLGMSDDGLLQRFAPVIIQRNGNGLDIPPDAATAERLATTAAGIAESEKDVLYRFSPEADAELHSIEAFKAREIARPDGSPMLRQWLDKMPNEFGRLSLIFHFIEWYASDLSADIGGGPAEFISLGTAARARRYLTEFVYPHARTFYLKELGTSEVDEHALWIAGFVLSRGLKTIKTRDIYRSYPALRAQEQRSQIATTMRVLEMYDWVRPIKERKGVDDEWAINPAVHDGRFADTAELERSRRGNVRETIQREAEARRSAPAD
ncbi:bifunctional DNA primase/polymerase [Bradyrhizobium iriomotense]|uniref:DNA primase/polymerase bifunctional N-terminal domain-containing protein n=1 Tax=Bradyrhizobium iriomotense TaxID=441950 RepID=A0ABQ6BC75_9BRAD|nr:bifunctional DNA primase/polymerase [Bradyrhizobium iriomotense]GLR91305.1 hypothetical protein GCM10007857_80220 [Bradyrhizobium iriomotense]